jgi:hypothetical protein
MYVERKGVWNLTKSKGSVAVSVKIKKNMHGSFPADHHHSMPREEA